jgi:hypothetical protein
MSGGVFRRAGTAVALVTAIGVGLTGCVSAKNAASTSAMTTTSAAPAMTTSSAAPTIALAPATATAPAAVAGTVPSPTGSICPDAPGTERIVMQSTGTVGGNFALVGFEELTICGPGVPDDVQYQNTGSLTTFVIPADTKVTLLGTSASTQYEVGVTQLKNLLASHSAPGTSYVLWSNYFELTFDSSGRIIGVISLYHP